MNQISSPLESGCAASQHLASESAQILPAKARYETPQLTSHGHLRDLTLSTGSSNMGDGGGLGP